jgi:adenylate cyclase
MNSVRMQEACRECSTFAEVYEMRGDDIIDVDADPKEARREFWQRIGRFGIPLAGVVLIVAAIIGIAFHSYQSNRNDALSLSQDLIESLNQRVRTEVQAYLAPAAHAVGTLAGMLPSGGLSAAGRPVLEKLALQLLQDRPQLASLYVGDPEGNFLMVQRSPEGMLDTKVIEHDGAQRRVTWYRRDREGQVEAVEEDRADTYDPRTRPWYRGATSVDGLFWTDVYIFFTAQKPGLTAAHAVSGPDHQVIAVAGGDIALEALSDFLAGLQIGNSGRAMIIDAQGRLVAFPDPSKIVEAANGEFRPAQLAELGEPLLTKVYDRIRVTGDGRSIVEIDDRPYVVAASSLAESMARDWSLVFVVPEEDFVGFVAANGRKMLWMSGGIVALAVGLAALLAYQGLIADRNARMLGQRERALAAQSSAFEELASTASLFEMGDQAGLRRLTEIVARALAARRVSLWQADDRRSEIVCVDCFDRETKGHTTGAEIRRAECPELLEALFQGDELTVKDAARDPRTSRLATVYLNAVGCRSLLSAPIASSSGVVGFVWIEDSGTTGRRQVDAESFTRTIAHMVSVRFAGTSGAETVAPAVGDAAATDAALPTPAETLMVAPPALRTSSISSERNRAMLRQISARGLNDDGLRANVFPKATALVLRFFDDLAMAASADGEQRVGVIERIVAAFQEIAERQQVRYVKIMTDQIVAVEGFDQAAHQAAITLSEVALALQDECSRSSPRQGGRLEYAIGLDTGTVIGSAVGFGQTAYNVWGEAVRLASTMAMTARRGTIQVSEASYEQLRERFVFRRSGGFYVEQVGEMTTYVLRGRL